MTRTMLDCTHSGLPGSLIEIWYVDIVAAYVTGSADVLWTPADYATIKAGMSMVTIDQADGGPVYPATVIDCEPGAWDVSQVDSRMALSTAARPTLYASPSTLAEVAESQAWRGDVWLALSSAAPPVTAPLVPAGFTVVAVQYDYANPDYDLSVVFDDAWPLKGATMSPAQIPPGQWNDSQTWTWRNVAMIGTGLNGAMYAFSFDPDTGKWTEHEL